ncbi:MAG: tetratricopeptide repeat protein [Deltaproteobacteria bacterium]|nr:MAG: tetratricopeptide repeat protein [Deltaproteobacteria bacterium]
MALTVLIVEDEQSASRLLSGIAAEVGLSARATASAKEAQELCAQAAASGQPFSAVVLDLVLSELDGFQFGAAARAASWGAKLPIIVISGIYKKLPEEFATRIQPAAFFAKPFEPAALRAALAKHTGSQSAAPPLEGALADRPVAAILVQLLREKASGILTVSQDTSKRLITFQQGMIRFAQSNVRAETIGSAQIASGLIKQTSFDRAVAIAKQQNIALHEALAAARVMTPEQLRAALKQQTVDVSIAAVGTLSGRFQFEQKPAEAVNGVPDMRTSPVALVLEAAKRLGNPAAAKPWLEQRAQDKLNRSPELEREMFALKTFWPGEAVTPVATGGRSIGEVLTRVKSHELPLLQYLYMSGLLALSATAKPGTKSQPAPSADEDKRKKFTAQEEAARASLFADRERLREASQYEVLGVAPRVSAEEIKTAWFAAAKRYHSDAFSGLDLGSARRVAEELFTRVNEANSALSDANRRAEYDVYLDRKAKGLPTDVGVILRAEGVFQRGEALFKSGRWDDAEAQFREAISLNDTEAEFHAFLGMAMFKRSGKPEEALPHVQKALKMEPRLQSGAIFLSQLYAAQGEVERAKSLLRKAIDKDPDFAQAKDELRRMRTAPVEQTKGGFLSRLLKK